MTTSSSVLHAPAMPADLFTNRALCGATWTDEFSLKLAVPGLVNCPICLETLGVGA